MVFNTALTGIDAATVQLDVIGNNIANASTTGFKESRTDFADIYTSNSGGGGQVGQGVAVAEVTQSLSQGNIELTGNSLDVAISGDGFFILKDDSGTSYSRAGAFALNKSGFIVNASNDKLQGLNADSQGILNQITTDIQIDTSTSSPNATEAITLGVNLDSGSLAPSVGDSYLGGIPVSDDTYTNLSSTTIYDSLGNSHILTAYYIKADSDNPLSDVGGGENEWYMGFQIDGNDIYELPTVTSATPADNATNLPKMSFSDDGFFSGITVPAGVPSAATGGVVETANILQLTYDLSNGSEPLDFTIDFDNGGLGASTQFGSDFTVRTAEQDGYATGRIEDLEVDTSGVIFGRFSNGQSRTLGQIQLASFKSPSDLAASDGTSWTETFASGTATIGVPETGNLGLLNSGALEESNVDLTNELVALISAQRDFQANAKTIQTADTVTQTIINLR